MRHFSIPSSFDTIKAKYALGFSTLDEGLLTVKYLELEFIVACHFQLNYSKILLEMVAMLLKKSNGIE